MSGGEFGVSDKKITQEHRTVRICRLCLRGYFEQVSAGSLEDKIALKSCEPFVLWTEMESFISKDKAVINSNDLRALEVPLLKGDPCEMICLSSNCLEISNI